MVKNVENFKTFLDLAGFQTVSPTEHLAGYKDGTILYKKVRMKNGKYLYSFRNPKMAYEQEVSYVEKARKKDKFNAETYAQKKSSFGLVVFKSKANLEPLDVYLALPTDGKSK